MRVARPGLIVFLAGVLTVAGVGGFFIVRGGENSHETRTQLIYPTRDEALPLAKLAPEIEDFLNADHIGTARAFAMSGKAEERLLLARGADLIAGRLQTYSPQARQEVPMEIRPIGFGTSEENHCALFKVVFPNGDTRLLSVVPTPDGSKVDWDCYARYCDASWDAIAAARVKAAKVRIFARPTRYFNFGFSDEDVWSCYSITSPDLEIPLYGYVKKGSPTDRGIREARGGKRGKAVRMILALDIREADMKNRQVGISGLVSVGWTLAE